MNGGSSSSSGQQSRDLTTTNTLPQMGQGESDLLTQLMGLDRDQFNTLAREIQQWTGDSSILGMTPGQASDLDLASQAGRNRLGDDFRFMADAEAGARGLRMSDTPAAESALRKYGAAMSGFHGGVANTGLDLGLTTNMNQARQTLGLTGTLPGASGFLGGQYMQERSASPFSQTTGSMTNYQSGTSRDPNQDLNTGLGIAGAVGTAATVAVAI
jgi:hypothetical protein